MDKIMIIKQRNIKVTGVLLFYLLTFLPISAQYDVVPMPQQIQLSEGETFVLDADVHIWGVDGLEREAAFLQTYLSEITGLQLPISTQKQRNERYIELTVSPKITEKEGYVLTVTDKSITIKGGSAAGVFYGIQTLRKSLSPRTSNFSPSKSPMPRASPIVACTSTAPVISSP